MITMTKDEVFEKIKEIREEILTCGWSDVAEFRYEQTGDSRESLLEAMTEQVNVVPPEKMKFPLSNSYKSYGVPRMFSAQLEVKYPNLTKVVHAGRSSDPDTPMRAHMEDLLGILASEGPEEAENRATLIDRTLSDTMVPEVFRGILVVMVPVHAD